METGLATKDADGGLLTSRFYSFLSFLKSLTDLEVVLGETLGTLANEVAREGMGIGSLFR